jgi:hypothetical protein
LQDIRNENQADYRAAQRMGQGNPAFQAQLNAQNMLLIKSGEQTSLE